MMKSLGLPFARTTFLRLTTKLASRVRPGTIGTALRVISDCLVRSGELIVKLATNLVLISTSSASDYNWQEP